MFRSDVSAEDEDFAAGGELGFLPERTCAICYQDQNPTSASESEIAAISAANSGIVGSSATDVTNPYETIPCGCIYCFVCIAQRLEAEDHEGWTCLRCGEIVKECKPWSGDVMIEQRPHRKYSSSSGRLNKRVSFLDEHEKDVADESFATLDPMPVEDEKSAMVSADISEDVDRRRGSSLDESAEWSRVGIDVTPPNGPAQDVEAHEGGEEDLASQALDFSNFDAGTALVDDEDGAGSEASMELQGSDMDEKEPRDASQKPEDVNNSS